MKDYSDFYKYKTGFTECLLHTNTNYTKIIKLGDRLLKKGMNGTDVSMLKRVLIEKRFLVSTTNDESMIFDEKTEKAVIAFQRSLGVGADGIVGSKTVYYLKK